MIPKRDSLRGIHSKMGLLEKVLTGAYSRDSNEGLIGRDERFGHQQNYTQCVTVYRCMCVYCVLSIYIYIYIYIHLRVWIYIYIYGNDFF